MILCGRVAKRETFLQSESGTDRYTTMEEAKSTAATRPDPIETDGRSDVDTTVNTTPGVATLVRKSRFKTRVTYDGCFIPLNEPNKSQDGNFVQPAGRPPEDMDWDSLRGIWIPSAPGSNKRSAASTTTADSIRPEDRGESSANCNSSGTMESTPRSSGMSKIDPSSSSFKKRKATPKRPTPPARPPPVPVLQLKDEEVHKTSKWREPARYDELTLYERQRMPRPVISGIVRRPIKALRQEFRCVICLGYIRHAKMVMECLHRFCEECIEKSLRMKNECPICRVNVVSRRSLAADPSFDRLIHSILGDVGSDDDDDDEEEEADNEKEEAASPSAAATATWTTPTLPPAIENKRTWVPPPRQQLDSGSGESDGRNERSTRPQEVPGARPPPLAPLIEIWLRRHKDEKQLEELALPFLRIQGDASVKILKVFLTKKLQKPNALIQIMSLMNGKPVILTDWIELQVVAKRLSDKSDSCINLFYRMEPHRVRGGHKRDLP